MTKKNFFLIALSGLLTTTCWAAPSSRLRFQCANNFASFAHTNLDGIFEPHHTRLGHFDLNGDGTITPDELSTASAGLVHELQTRFLARYDANGDGAVTADESLAFNEAVAEQWLRHLLRSFDRNRDGAITRTDFARYRHAHMPTDLLAYDTDGDGGLSQAELVAAAEAKAQELQTELLAKYDADSDGTITADEALAIHQDLVAAKIQALLTAFDTNGDGTITADELAALRGPRGHRR
jgi:Ca2+-binding EF-hand superfamily protein